MGIQVRANNNFSGMTVAQRCDIICCGGLDGGRWRGALELCLDRHSLRGWGKEFAFGRLFFSYHVLPRRRACVNSMNPASSHGHVTNSLHGFDFSLIAAARGRCFSSSIRPADNGRSEIGFKCVPFPPKTGFPYCGSKLKKTAPSSLVPPEARK